MVSVRSDWVKGRVLKGIGAYTVVRGVAIPGFRYLFPLYVLSLGYSTADLGIIASLAAIVSATLLPLAGYLTDRGYALHVGTASGIMVAASLVVPVVWPSYASLALAYAFSNLGMMMWQPSRSSMVAKLVESNVLGRYFGIYMFLFNIARVVTPFALAIALQWVTYGRLMLWLGLTVSAGAVAFAVATSPARNVLLTARNAGPSCSTHNTGVNRSRISALRMLGCIYKGTFLMKRALLPLLAFGILDKFGWLMWLPMQNAYLKEVIGFSDGEVGLYNSMMGMTMLIASLPAGHFTDRLGAVKALILNEILGAAGALLIVSGLPSLIYASSFLIGWSFSLWVTSYNTMTALILGPENVGRVRASIDSAGTYLSIPAPSVGALLLKSVCTTAPFIVGAILMLSATAPLLTWSRLSGKSGKS